MSYRLLAACSFLVAATISSAAPLFDSPVPEITLTNGEVLHDVQAKGFNTTSVLVKYREGAKTVPYDHFPANYRDLLLARKPQSRPASAIKPVSVVTSETEKPKKVSPPDRLPGEKFKGLSLLSVSPGPDFATAEIYNDNTDTAAIEPGALQAELDNGKLVIGRHWVETNEQGMISSTLKGSQEIQPRSTASLKVSFAVPPGVAITRVVWSQN